MESNELWTRKELEERIALLSKKYYPGYVDPNPDASIYKFKRALAELIKTGVEKIALT